MNGSQLPDQAREPTSLANGGEVLPTPKARGCADTFKSWLIELVCCILAVAALIGQSVPFQNGRLTS